MQDATEKVLILRQVAQDKVYLYVLRYYILYVKTVFQWRPCRSGGILAYYMLKALECKGYVESLGGAALGDQKEGMFGYDIPNILRLLCEDKECI